MEPTPIAAGEAESAVAGMPLPVPAPPSALAHPPAPVAVVPAPAISRAIAYVIDVFVTLILFPLALIPIAGHVIVGILLGCYWFFRDAKKFSLGKKAMNLRILTESGGEPTEQQLTKRNLPLAIAGFILAAPLIGLVLGPIAGFIAVLMNAILIITEGRTLGDKWAGTIVVEGNRLPGNM